MRDIWKVEQRVEVLADSKAIVLAACSVFLLVEKWALHSAASREFSKAGWKADRKVEGRGASRAVLLGLQSVEQMAAWMVAGTAYLLAQKWAG